MYKRTHDSHDYLRRVASHSTKGSRRGVVSVLPPGAKEQVIGNFRERKDALNAKLFAAKARVDQARAEFQRHRPAFEEWRRYYSVNKGRTFLKEPPHLTAVRDQYAEARRAYSEIQDEVEKLNRVAHPKRLRSKTWAEIFVQVAELTLDADVFARLVADARNRYAIAKAADDEREAAEAAAARLAAQTRS